MTFNILLYGATGHSGEMIAARAAKDGLAGCQMFLAGRDLGRLVEASARHRMPFRRFGLDDPADVQRNLAGIDLVVNAAGPFASTAYCLAQAAIEAPCSYLDINGEVDVYMKLDDLARRAERQGVAIISSAGHSGAGSCLLLHRALKVLAKRYSGQVGRPRLSIRVAMSLPPEYSQGSAVTALRLLREQVLTIRRGQTRDRNGACIDAMVKWHVPAGRLDRAFDFSVRMKARGKQPPAQIGIATAANMVDTLVALQVVRSQQWQADAIESYLQMDLPARVTYQVASTLSSLTVLPQVAAPASAWARFLTPSRPNAVTDDDRQVIVLEIDDDRYERVIDWRLSVPSSYEFTAQLVIELAKGLSAKGFQGWVTPNQVLTDVDAALKDCILDRRISRGAP